MMNKLFSMALVGLVLLPTQFVQADIIENSGYPAEGLPLTLRISGEEFAVKTTVISKTNYSGLYDHGYGLRSPCGCVVMPEPCLRPYPPRHHLNRDKIREVIKEIITN